MENKKNNAYIHWVAVGAILLLGFGFIKRKGSM